MMIVIIAALLLAAPFVAAWYLRLAKRSLMRAGKAWAVAEQHAHVLLEDSRLDPDVGDLVEAVIGHVGDGKLTRAMLWSFVAGRHGGRRAPVLPALNHDQERQFLHFLIAALLYDSLRAPLSGALLRRVMYWLAGTAADRSAPVNRVQVEPVMSAAGRMCMAG